MNRESIVFLDRDGTINVDVDYISDVRELKLIPGAATAVAKLKKQGFKIIVVTNQSGIARGFTKPEDVEAVNQALQEMLLQEDNSAVIDDIYYCPHGPDDDCACRKPKTGMVAHLTINPTNCWIVGDKVSDLEFGQALGIPSEHQILLLTGHGEEQLSTIKSQNKHLPLYCQDLAKAVELIRTV